MKPFMMILITLSLIGCVNSPTLPNSNVMDVSGAQATYSAAAEQARIASARATLEAGSSTRTAAEVTAVAAAMATGTTEAFNRARAATADSVAYSMTWQTMNAQATREAIAAKATGTAVNQLAQAEHQLIVDEAQRLTLQRQSELVALAYQRRMNQLRPFLWGGVVLALILVAGSFALLLWQRSRPFIVPPSSGQILIPTNSYQVLPAPRERLGISASTESVRETAVRTPIPLPPMTQGHVLIAGETGSGKTTALQAILKRRHNVTILDPHDDSITWAQAQVIGGGRNFQAIGEYMTYMKQLLTERYNQRSQGQREFAPITVATDEMPAIVSALGRGIDETWRMWLREGRKVGLFFVVSTQSTRVKTLGIKGEGDLLENFTYVLALGKVAANQYPDLVQGMVRPAIIRTIEGIRPVVIPFASLQEISSGPRQTPLIIAPIPLNQSENGHYADPVNMTDADRTHIRHLAQTLPSRRAIEKVVFGYTGGAAYRAVKGVLDANGANSDG